MSSVRPVDIAARAAAILGPLSCAAYGLVAADSLLAGGAAWLVVLAASLAGWGHVANRWLPAPVDLGLRLAWGAGAVLAIAGWFLAADLLSRPVLLGLVLAGVAAFAWQQATASTPPLLSLLRAARGAGRHPQAAAFWIVVVVIAMLNVASALAEIDGNVYDDDIIYTPLVRRLLETGGLDEPFSFRRLSAYGGQTVLQGLAASRGTLGNLFLVDGALFQLIAILLVVGMARAPAASDAGVDTGRRPFDQFLVGLVVVVLLLLPSTSVNTASYWTGAVFFLALYRTIAAAASDGAQATRLFALAGMVAASVCTLRQSYLPVAALFLVLVLAFRLGAQPRLAIRTERRIWLATLIGGAVAIAPYCIAAYHSNQTFLYPFWPGTANASVHMQPALPNLWHELQFLVETVLEPDPIRVALPLLPVVLLAADRRPGRPLTALAIASGLGFLLLVHSFQLSVPQNLWRYAFGYATALALILAIEAARSSRDDSDVRISLLGRVAVAGCLLIQLAVSGRGLVREYRDLAADLTAAAATGGQPIGEASVETTYRDLQSSVPSGATLAVMLDQPYHLDHRRNRILNLDTPGFASARPGMPYFQGPEPVVRYFLAQQIRYLAFVRGDRSRYMYRRDFWLHRALFDTELWRIQGGYLVDCVDTFAAIARDHRLLFERDGMVVVDLGEPSS